MRRVLSIFLAGVLVGGSCAPLGFPFRCSAVAVGHGIGTFCSFVGPLR